MSSKPKILILLPVFDLGGAEKQGYYIAKSLQDSGLYEVEVWALDNGSGNLCPLLESSNLRFTNLKIPFGAFYNRKKRLSVYLQFIKALRKAKINAVIPFTYHCNVLATSTYKFAGVKKCLWFQIAMEFHIPMSTFEKLALKFKPIYASNSKAAGKFIAEKHGQNATDVSFIPNPFEKITVKTEKEEWRLKLGIAEDEIMLFMAANFFPEKDHETLIKGFHLALKQNSKLKLVLAGNHNNVERISIVKSNCFDLGLNSEHVIFIGASDDVPGLIGASDICLLTSVSEGSPNALIEYMGYGKPIVASSIPSIIELLKPENPYLFEAQNSEDLSVKIIEMISSLGTEYCQNLVKANQKRVLTEYTIQANFNAFHKLLSA
jgi:glycosyltransferase involved in cell wall biosynthesis